MPEVTRQSSMPQMEVNQYQGPQIASVPTRAGLYAWYYKPLVVDKETVGRTLSTFMESPGIMSTEIRMRYGVILEGNTNLSVSYGAQRQAAAEVLEDAIERAGTFFSDFFKSKTLQLFTRPIYIGVAKNLYQRVYQQHYLTLDEYWGVDNPINKFLTSFPTSDVQSVINRFDLQHSFAIEARVRGISPRDLAVHVYPTDELPRDIGPDSDDPLADTPTRLALERIFQLLADPVCGRR